MKVALVHHWMVGMRGGEKVLQSLCRIFPDADIFTHVYDDKNCGEAFVGHKITETFISKLPFAKKLYQSYLPLMPSALEELDMNGYELIISIESGPSKGIIPPPDSLHICYVNSPMRYIWDQYREYRRSAGWLAKIMMPFFAPGLRQWDVTSSARIDYVASNSAHIAKRVKKYWRRDSTVIHPPVFVDDFNPVPNDEVEDFYLWLGELAPYKRPDLAVEAFNANGKKLVIIGGPDKTVSKLKAVAKDNITFLGKADFSTLKSYLARCKALIFPGEEDFGIVPVEAMASGRPVIAYGRGGALDYVVHGETGWLFKDQSVDGLNAAISEFEAAYDQIDFPAKCVEKAASFSEQVFHDKIKAAVSEGLQQV